jgi:hypothetical protein
VPTFSGTAADAPLNHPDTAGSNLAERGRLPSAAVSVASEGLDVRSRDVLGDTWRMRRRRHRDLISFDYFRLFTFGSAEELVAAFGSLEGAERIWSSIRDEFMERWNLWGMPEAWWRFEPGVPPELAGGPHAIITDADAAAWDRVAEGRRRYLREIGIDPTSRSGASAKRTER